MNRKVIKRKKKTSEVISIAKFYGNLKVPLRLLFHSQPLIRKNIPLNVRSLANNSRSLKEVLILACNILEDGQP